MRAEMLYRIENSAKKENIPVQSDVFRTREAWREYAFKRYAQIDRIAQELKYPESVLHQWPDPDLGSKAGFMSMKLMQAQRVYYVEKLSAKQIEDAEAEWEKVERWLQYWHDDQKRISAWPKKTTTNRKMTL